MKKVFVSLALVAALAGCGGTTTTEPGPTKAPAVESVTEAPEPVNPVLDRISKESDCTTLQGEFDQAYENATARAGSEAGKQSLKYMDAADKRMKDVGCY